MSRNLRVSFLFYWFFSLVSISIAYRPGDVVPMSKIGQYHLGGALRDICSTYCLVQMLFFFFVYETGLVMSFILAIYVLQSSQDKLARFVSQTVVESSMPRGGVAKVE